MQHTETAEQIVHRTSDKGDELTNRASVENNVEEGIIRFQRSPQIDRKHQFTCEKIMSESKAYIQVREPQVTSPGRLGRRHDAHRRASDPCVEVLTRQGGFEACGFAKTIQLLMTTT